MKLLIFQHLKHEPPGNLSVAAKLLGHTITIIELWKPYVLPAIMDYDGLIILGGSMGVYDGPDKFPSQADELEYIKNTIGKRLIWGICLGAHLIAKALGAKVYPNIKDGHQIKEIGYYDMELTEAGKKDSLFIGFKTPFKVMQWHGDAFDIPTGATLLASSPVCNQAFRYENDIYATLFHTEFTPGMVAEQIEEDRDWIHKDFVIDEVEFKKQSVAYEKIMQHECAHLLKNWLSATK